MKSPKLSIIIPATNPSAVTYLPAAFSRLAEQGKVDFSDIEIIVILSQEVNFDQQFPSLPIKQIIVTNQIGPNPARQLGLWNAKGEWIFFHDSDDVLHDSCSLSKMLSLCEKDANYDFFTFQQWCERDQKNLTWGVRSLQSICVKKNIYKKYHIDFLDMNIYEDVYVCQCLMYLSDYNYIDEPDVLYDYLYHANSLTQNKQRKKSDDFVCDVRQSLYVETKMIEFGKQDWSFYLYLWSRLTKEASQSPNRPYGLLHFAKRYGEAKLRYTEDYVDSIAKQCGSSCKQNNLFLQEVLGIGDF